MRLSVHLLVRNGAGVVDRALRSVLDYADEVVYVDSGSTDGTIDVVRDVCSRFKVDCRGVSLDLADDRWFFTDDPSAWRRATPGPHTGARVLRRWDEARNLGLELCGGDYVFKLDADDEVVDSSGLRSLLSYLDVNRHVENVMCPYEVVGESSVAQYLRLWCRRANRRFVQAIHEYLPGCGVVGGRLNYVAVARGLRVKDWRDSGGEGVRVPNRNYKVFLMEYERRLSSGDEIDDHFLLSTIGEVDAADPELGAEIRRIVANRERPVHPR